MVIRYDHRNDRCFTPSLSLRLKVRCFPPALSKFDRAAVRATLAPLSLGTPQRAPLRTDPRAGPVLLAEADQTHVEARP